jgi:uncharacterized protein (DUF305 family)
MICVPHIQEKKHMKTVRILVMFVTLVGMTVALPAFADAPIDGRVGRAELRFLEGMIDHHQMALDMSNDCLVRTDISDALRTECQAVIDAQQAEIEQMQAWLLAWYNVQYTPMSMLSMQDDGMAGMDHSGMDMGSMPATDPAMMMGMMAGFNRLDGIDYEIAWLESMVDHHDDAMHMSERLLSRDADGTGHVDLRALAQAIIDAQSAEITRYEQMISAINGE